MALKDRVIKPQFFYDKDQTPIAVYLSIDDYMFFMNKLKKLSDEIRNNQMKTKKSKKRI